MVVKEKLIEVVNFYHPINRRNKNPIGGPKMPVFLSSIGPSDKTPLMITLVSSCPNGWKPLKVDEDDKKNIDYIVQLDQDGWIKDPNDDIYFKASSDMVTFFTEFDCRTGLATLIAVYDAGAFIKTKNGYQYKSSFFNSHTPEREWLRNGLPQNLTNSGKKLYNADIGRTYKTAKQTRVDLGRELNDHQTKYHEKDKCEYFRNGLEKVCLIDYKNHLKI